MIREHLVPGSGLQKLEIYLSYDLQVPESEAEAREPTATEKPANKSDPGLAGTGAEPAVTVRHRCPANFAVYKLDGLMSIGHVRINVAAAYHRQNCKLASSKFEPLYIADPEDTEIQMYSFAQCMKGLKGTAPKRGLMHKRHITRKNPN